MANEKKVVTGLGKPEIHRVLIRGYDLTKDLVGKITFADMTYLMLVGRFPNDGERRMTDALLTILVEHGMVSSVVSARLCYSTAPEALQAAVASSILGAGSVHLGSSEWSAKMLVKALPAGSSPADLDAAAASVVEQHAKKKKRIAGIGHRTHPEGDPRAVRLFEIARETGVYGRYCDFSKGSARRRKRSMAVLCPLTSPAPSAQSRSTWGSRGRSPKHSRSSGELWERWLTSAKRFATPWLKISTPPSSHRWFTTSTTNEIAGCRGRGLFERLERLERLELYREGYRPSMKPLSSNFLHRLMSTISSVFSCDALGFKPC